MVSPRNANDAAHATDINDDGYVIVNYYKTLGDPPWYSYIWKDGRPSLTGLSYGVRINNSNQITGYSSFGEVSIGEFWDGVRYILLEELEGSQYWSRPNALNDDGQIFGVSLGDFSSPGGWKRAVGWTQSGQLYELGMKASESSGNIPQAANNLGQVVGYADSGYSSLNTSHAWLWQNGTAEILPTLSNAVAPRSWAYGINNHGQIVGAYFEDTTLGVIGGAALWADGTLSILDDPIGARYGVANDINEAGFVVGFATPGGAPYASATLWSPDGTAFLLDNLVENLEDWKLERAIAINNRNQIVGIARDTAGTQRGFLLTPLVPEPTESTLMILALCLFVLWRPKFKASRVAAGLPSSAALQVPPYGSI